MMTELILHIETVKEMLGFSIGDDNQAFLTNGICFCPIRSITLI